MEKVGRNCTRLPSLAHDLLGEIHVVHWVEPPTGGENNIMFSTNSKEDLVFALFYIQT